MKDQRRVPMFCFQSPFTRGSSRGSAQSSRTASPSAAMQRPPDASAAGSRPPTTADHESTGSRRRGSETNSEGSGSSSIKYIDQEATCMSGSSSTDTLPGIRADYLDVDPLSSPETPVACNGDLAEPDLGTERPNSGSFLSVNPPSTGPKENRPVHLSPNGQKSNGGGRWRRRFLLRLRSTESSTSSTGEPSPTPSPSPSPTPSPSPSPGNPNHVQRSSFSSAQDIPALENGFGEASAEGVAKSLCVEEGSLPSSPAPGVGLAPGGGAYYAFLTANCVIRQEPTSTSSPQLSSAASTPRASVDSPISYKDLPQQGATLEPQTLEASCLPAARSCPNLERQSGPSSPSPSPGPAGPRFKPLEEGDIQVCYLNHTRTLVSKILSNKFLRRWETHHLYLNDACLSSRTLTGFLQHPVPYSSMSEVYAVARWDPTYKYCLRIVLPDGSLLLQAGNAYTRDQWYHSILWKKSIFKYQHLVSVSTREEVVLRELKAMVDFALWTPLQDERVAGAPLEAVARLLEEPEAADSKSGKGGAARCDGRGGRNWAEAVLAVAAPLLEKVAPPPTLARALARLAQLHPRSPLVAALAPAITRCLKHTVDFGKSPDMRKLLQVFVAALYENNDGEQAIRDYIASVHGPGSDCPHPRVLPNLVSICVAAIFHRFEVARHSSSADEQPASSLPPLQCYLLLLNVASEYADWRPGLGGLLQPVPFPEEALADKAVQLSLLVGVAGRLAKDPRCSVHRCLLPVREPRPGWIHIAAPASPACPDQGQLFGEMLTTLFECCCRRKKFVGSLMKQAGGACILLGVRGCDAAQEALCLMLEWRLLPNEEARLQVVSALQSTASGRTKYAALCQRQRNLQELQQKGGPKKLTLPVRATDADVALLLGGGALGNLECLSLAFTSVTSACAEQLIKLPALRYLNLWATQFGDAGLQMISEHLQKLQVLNLCETPVSDKGISTLASLTSLRKLNLNSTKLSAQTFESLKKRLPALQEFDVRYTEAW
ncbi:C-Maf-inducing protein-like [Neodiprion virginianus]|uniref:C-Maf-inducing protein-like n=1 Tax=Neodiprion virginianus TaxID=2961670 RepID=UPI001EE77DA7|nr:C-Maf-inducing protein-like [Neodiprion virginianus]XP_046629602.1 C-Maf-inducing protein-like [Neodiprion virginianus]